MKILNRLLATLGLCGLLLFPMSNIGGIHLLDDFRFISVEETIGKTQEEVRKEIGSAHSTGPCAMATPIEGQLVSFQGEGWEYHGEFDNGKASLSICFVKGYSVGEQRVVGQMSEEGRESVTLSAVFDHRVLRKVIEGEPGRPDWVDPDGPDI